VPDLRRFNLLVFDFDGTLANTAYDISWCMRQTFESFSKPQPSEEAILKTMGFPLEFAFRDLCRIGLAAEEISIWIHRYRSIYNTHGDLYTRLYPGTEDLLARIKKAGVSVVIATNKAHDAIEGTLTRLGVRHLIDLIFADGNTDYQKPDPLLFSREIKSYFSNVNDDQVLVVGDSEIDLRFARNSGLPCCWAKYGYGNSETCRNLNPEFIIDDIREVDHILEIRDANVPVGRRPARDTDDKSNAC
jgi:phosphoglycolate phosphatase